MENQLIARVFSSDSMSVHPQNTLSSFISEIENEVNLGEGEWVVGIKQLFLNSVNHGTTMSKYAKGRDVIIIPKEVRTFSNLQDFIDYVIERAIDPSIYIPSYFGKYLDKNILHQHDVFDDEFKDDFIPIDIIQDTLMTIEMKLEALLTPEELSEVREHNHDLEINLLKKVFNLKIPVNRQPFKLRAILQRIIRDLVLGYRGVDDSNEYVRRFATDLNAYPDFQEMMHAIKFHQAKLNQITQRLVRNFVEGVQKSLKRFKPPKLDSNKQVFIYCDIIKPQLLSGMRSRLLQLTPLEINHEKSFHYENFSNIEFVPVEKKRFKNIKFELRNEDGEFVNFHPSTTPNFITLIFRRL